MIPSADTFARALIGAARANGDDPLAIASDAYGARRCIPPAIAALHRVSTASFAALCRPLGISERAFYAASKRKSHPYLRGLVGALLALDPKDAR